VAPEDGRGGGRKPSAYFREQVRRSKDEEEAHEECSAHGHPSCLLNFARAI